MVPADSRLTSVTEFIVFGGGLKADSSTIELSQSSVLRVKALVNYVRENRAAFFGRRGRIVFTGGWPGAAKGMEPPPVNLREAMLMQLLADQLLSDEKLGSYADINVEIDSDSSAENVLRVKEYDFFKGTEFTPVRPLGLVSQAGHLKRINYLVQKILGLQGDSLLDIVAPEPAEPSSRLAEKLILTGTRLAFAGASDYRSFRARHDLLVRAARIRGHQEVRDPRSQ